VPRSVWSGKHDDEWLYLPEEAFEGSSFLRERLTERERLPERETDRERD